MKVYIKNRQRLIRINPQRLKRHSLRLLRSFNLRNAELGVLLVNDRQMKKLNHIYRGVDKTTDVLSFPIYNDIREIPDDRDALIGDIAINLQTAKVHSLTYGCTFNEELLRLFIHGFLHLLGFDHEKNIYQKRRMTKKERELHDALKAMA